jgi:hypothetical protein
MLLTHDAVPTAAHGRVYVSCRYVFHVTRLRIFRSTVISYIFTILPFVKQHVSKVPPCVRHKGIWRGVKIQLHSFSISVLNGSER